MTQISSISSLFIKKKKVYHLLSFYYVAGPGLGTEDEVPSFMELTVQLREIISMQVNGERYDDTAGNAKC